MVEEEKLDVGKWLQDLKEKAKGEEKLNPFIEMLEKNKKQIEKESQDDVQKGKEFIENLMKKHKPREYFNWEDFIKKYKK